MDKKFNLEHQYQFYLEKVKLNEEDMHPVQRVETKRAFMCACGQILVLIQNDLAEIEDQNEILKIYGSMMMQVVEYLTPFKQN